LTQNNTHFQKRRKAHNQAHGLVVRI